MSIGAEKHAVFLSYDGMTDPLGQSQVIPYLSGLSARGYRISLISFEKPAMAHRREFIQNLLDRHKIEWHPQIYTKSPPIFSTIYDLVRMRLVASKVFRETPFQIVHARSYVPALVALSLKKKFGIKFVFDMRGFWPDERVDGGLWNLKSPIYNLIYRFFKKKEIDLLRASDFIITLTESAKSQIHAWRLEPKPLPIQVIPCCVDLEVFSHAKVSKKAKDEWKQKLKIREGDFILTYLGSIGTWYRLEEMLKLFQALIKRYSNAKFLFVSRVSPDLIYQTAANVGIERDRLLVISANREDVPTLLSLSTASVFFYGVELSRAGFSPTKAAELLSLGIPIICNSGVGDCDDLVKNESVGVLVADFTMAAYEDAVQRLDAVLKMPKENMIKAAEKRFNLATGIENYEKVYRQLLA